MLYTEFTMSVWFCFLDKRRQAKNAEKQKNSFEYSEKSEEHKGRKPNTELFLSDSDGSIFLFSIETLFKQLQQCS
jgi:hypothetical protein